MPTKFLTACLSFYVTMAQAIPCDSPTYRQFDFWLGNWQVTNTQNTNKSISKISQVNNGCTLLEEYETPTGYVGKSLNIYDATSQKWHQTWTDNTGVLLQLDGQFNGTSMVLTGNTTNSAGNAILNRITWTPNQDGTVRQLWESSEDNGKVWQVLFDGLYSKA